MILPFQLRCFCHGHSCGIEHILNKNSVPRGGVADQHVRDRADELAILDDRAAAQVCGQERTTVFCKIFIKLAHRLGDGALFLSVLNNL